MKGSEKQIKWATDIRQSKLEAFEKLMAAAKNEIAVKAATYIRDNEAASFWIDHRATSPVEMVRKLVTTGLSIRGDGFEDVAVMDVQTGMITEYEAKIVTVGKEYKIERKPVRTL